MSPMRTPMYGRLLGDFETGASYLHPWEVTLTDGMLAFFAASFQDAMPLFASAEVARNLGFRDRPIHPTVLLNLGLSFSVHDVSEQAIAHLAYIDVRFPEPAYVGDTVYASSKVLNVKPSSSGDKGVVHVRTLLQNQDGAIVCAFERRALVRAGKLEGRPPAASSFAQPAPTEVAHLPAQLREGRARAPARPSQFAGFFEELEPGQVFAHYNGRTVGDSEHMQLTTLLRNSHPLHFDEVYCRDNSFASKRVVYGGLVLSWVLGLTSRDLAGNALWDMGLDAGAHPNPTLAGDTLFAASRVEAKREVGPDCGAVTLRIVGIKNTRPSMLISDGVDLFKPELEKKEGRIGSKVVEISRTLLVRKRSG